MPENPAVVKLPLTVRSVEFTARFACVSERSPCMVTGLLLTVKLALLFVMVALPSIVPPEGRVKSAESTVRFPWTRRAPSAVISA